MAYAASPVVTPEARGANSSRTTGRPANDTTPDPLAVPPGRQKGRLKGQAGTTGLDGGRNPNPPPSEISWIERHLSDSADPVGCPQVRINKVLAVIGY